MSFVAKCSYINAIKNILDMCTNPLSRHIKSPSGSVRIIKVPCGQCAECRASKQSEVAALSVLEANKSTSVNFVTLTYNSNSLPINLVEHGIIIGEQRGRYCCSDMINVWNKECRPSKSSSTWYVPSLRRRDFQAHLKRFRSYLPDKDRFRFWSYGEYGSQFHRPHYHALLYNLTPAEVQKFCELWEKYYGFTYVKEIPRFNPDGSSGFGCVSSYVSKYIMKRDDLPDFVQCGYAEKPRRQSSIRLGQKGLDFDSMRNFI